MTCREGANYLALFFDGELEPRQMRALALHSTRCASCESELRQMERIQEAVGETLAAAVDELDLSNFWPAIERRLGTVTVPWWQRLRTRWDEPRLGRALRVPGFAAALAAAVLAWLWLARVPQPTTQPAVPLLAAVDNGASIDSLDADFDSVAVLSDPETRTTVLWVSDDVLIGEELP